MGHLYFIGAAEVDKRAGSRKLPERFFDLSLENTKTPSPQKQTICISEIL